MAVIRSIGDLINITPELLGFSPDEGSVVVYVIHDAALMYTVRMDSAAATPEYGLGTMLAPARREASGPVRIILTGWSVPPDVFERWLMVAIDLPDAILVDAAGICGSRWVAIGGASGVLSFDPMPSREEVVESLQPRPIALPVVTEFDRRRAMAAWSRVLEGQWSVEDLSRICDDPDPTVRDAVVWAFGADYDVPDQEVARWAEGLHVSAALPNLITAAQQADDATPWAVLANVYLLRGEVMLGRVCVEHALRCDPLHRLAGLLLVIADHGGRCPTR